MINEKTLELNLVHEMVSDIENMGFSAAVIGLDQLTEARKGYDVALLSSVFVGFLQFKRGLSRPKYVSFRLNNNSRNNQHDRLLIVSGRRRGRCYYVFPRITSNTALIQNIGSLLKLTVFYDVLDIPILTGTGRSHAVRLHAGGNIQVFSKPTDVNSPQSWTQVLGVEGDRLHRTKKPDLRNERGNWAFGAPIQEVLESIKGFDFREGDLMAMRALVVSPRNELPVG